MTRVHAEFAFQSRELGGQIEDTLGDPPNRKYYARVVNALQSEYAKGSGIDDVNMMSFALVDNIGFHDQKGLLAASARYEVDDGTSGEVAKVLGMASCQGEVAAKMYESIAKCYPAMARQAVIIAFLYKNPRLWKDEDLSLDTLAANDDGDDVDTEGEFSGSEEFTQIFDRDEEKNA